MPPRIACFAMSDRNHLNGVLPVAAQLVRAGADVRFWTDPSFRVDVERAGAEFADIYDGVPLDLIDDSSRPLPSRYVTFAAARGRQLAQAAKLWDATLVLHDGFALVGRLVGEQLGRPWVTVVPGWSVDAPASRAALAEDPRLRLDPRCLQAVERLRTEFGIPDATPHHYIGDPSPWLNLHKQPAQWLTAEEAAKLAPVSHFGCLRDERFPAPREPSARLRVYASFGTIVWRYWPEQALSALVAVVEGTEVAGGVDLTVGLGGSGRSVEALQRPHVRVLPYAEQLEVLAGSDLFITHQGLNSTHEAIASLTPMLSLPFFADQPGLSAKAEGLGIAMPLVRGMSGQDGRLTAAQVAAAIAAVRVRYDQLRASIAQARQWELEVFRQRPATVAQMLALS